MAPTLRPKTTSLAVGSIAQPIPEARPQETPEGHVQDLPSSSQAQAQPRAQSLVLVPGTIVRDNLPPPPPTNLAVPADAVQQLVQLLQRQELVNQARTLRFTQLEHQVAELRGRQVTDQGSPDRKSDDRRRRHHHSPPHTGNYHRSPSRNDGFSDSSRHSSWGSSSPRRRSRSREESPRRNDHVRGFPEHRNRRRSPPRPSANKRKNPFTHEINSYRVPRYLEKPPEKLPTYSGIGDPDRHIDKYDDLMEYRIVPPEMRCRIFPLTLDGLASEWFRTLKPNSISSWDQLAKLFCDHFGHSKAKPKSKDCLLAVRQGVDEPLRDYIERFNKEAATVRNLDDEFRVFFMTQGLLEGSDFKTHIRRWEPKTLQEFLQTSMCFINEEEGAKTGKEVSKPGSSKPTKDHQEWRSEGRNNDNRGNRDTRPRNRHRTYTDLNVSNAQLYGECWNAEFRDVKTPKPLPHRPGQRSNKYCRYHRSPGHDTNHCNALKDDIEDLIQRGKLSSYIKKPGVPVKEVKDEKNSDPRDKGKSRAESDAEEPDPRRSKGHAVMMMIAGGFDDGESMKTQKRKWKELMNIASTSSQLPQSVRPPLSFGDDDLMDGKPNKYVPLIISAGIANREVRRILVDQGSSSDILFIELLDRMGIGMEELTPYRGNALTGFNGSRSHPLGYLEVMVSYGSEPLVRTIKTKFLILPCRSIYNGIIGRPTIGRLGAVTSTTHLKMKFHSLCNKVITLHSDLESASRCFFLWTKAEQEALKLEGVPPLEAPSSKKIKNKSSEVNATDLDARYDPESSESEEDDDLAKELKKKMKRPQPDGELIEIQLGNDPEKVVKIGADLPEHLKTELTRCLKDHSDLFAWSAEDMPGIPPEVACHQLAVNPEAKWVAQRKRAQSKEKAEAAAKAVDDLLKANFISEVKYTTWLANPVLVKKSNGKWRMCVDYTDLNRACPKDAFPVPCIDQLVDSASGFQLLSFMDAYSGYNQIAMFPPDQEKTAFMTDRGNFAYRVMPFGLKNAGATYQRMMNKVFRNQIGKNVEVYLDDMIAKSELEDNHVADLTEIFAEVRRNSMRLNPDKCTFGVRAGKFLGYYLTEKGIEANPDKCRVVTEMKTPTTKNEIQKLNGMIAALSRFISNAAFKSLPLFKLLRKGDADFEWTHEQDQALKQLQKALSEPPILSRPLEGETLYLYLSVSEGAIGAVLVRDTEAGQSPVYFISKALHGSENRYQRVEKIALALVVAARRLRPYFVAHQINVRTNYPIRQILHRPDLAGRMIKWAIELSEFDIKYESRLALKAQVLADFVAEMTPPEPVNETWILHVDGSSNPKGSGAGIMLESPEGVVIEVSLSFNFPTSNNQAEYEACIAGLRLAIDLRASRVSLHTDSLLVVSQISKQYKTEDPILQRYLVRVRELLAQIGTTEVKHVPRAENQRADILSKLASTKSPGNHRTVIQEVLRKPSISPEVPTTMSINVVEESQGWISPILNYILSGAEPPDPREARLTRRRATFYSVIDGTLYRRGLSAPLLKCIEGEEADYVLAEIHEGICGQHLGARSLARKALRSGYYWPTMETDAKNYVKKCKKCQIHANLHNAPPHELTALSATWPFAWWGVDLLGPFATAPGQVRFLIVAIDYMSKWIEAEPLSTITSKKCTKFFKVNIMCRFGIPEVVVTDNGTQFAGAEFRKLMSDLGVKHRFTSVEHPQTNGQVEAANKVILKGLKKRLDDAKGNWVDELPHVLWAYRTTPQSSTGETPFRLSYGSEAVIPVEIGEPSWRTSNPKPQEENNQELREDLDLIEGVRGRAILREALIKQGVAARYNAKVVPRDFEVGDLVLRRADVGLKNSAQGKLAPNWEGPYRVTSKTGNGAFKLETIEKKPIERTWNAAKLRAYYV